MSSPMPLHAGEVCCICFTGITSSTAWRDPRGDFWDMCVSCGDAIELEDNGAVFSLGQDEPPTGRVCTPKDGQSRTGMNLDLQ